MTTAVITPLNTRQAEVWANSLGTACIIVALAAAAVLAVTEDVAGPNGAAVQPTGRTLAVVQQALPQPATVDFNMVSDEVPQAY